MIIQAEDTRRGGKGCCYTMRPLKNIHAKPTTLALYNAFLAHFKILKSQYNRTDEK